MGTHLRGIQGRRRPHLQAVTSPMDRLSLDFPALDEAACRTENPELFFSEAESAVQAAKTVCERCRVQGACLERALAAGEAYGVFGGLTPDERHSLSRRRRKGAAA
ncbi:WhiB family transcriptional regulator [Streptomyces sp. NPDC004546]|uniref:WhiB family transcriptional regulator n=1 Tax=Streptomyces sp. NPDC004546 TaxID=3154282 RepID=UPI0033A994C1